MRLVSWGLLLLYSAAITCVQDFQNHCADASKAMSALPQDLKIDRPFKVSAIVTDWKANSTMLIDEIRRNASFVIETTEKNSTSKLSTMDNQLLLSNNTGCSVVLDHTLFTLPSEITTIFPLEVTSLSGLVNDIINRTIPGFKSYAKIVSGVEGVGWVGCVNSTNSSAVVAVEVVYAGEESFNPPSPTFKNPVILSLVFSHFANVSDANSTMAARISLDFTPFREPLDLTSQLEITHGTFCSGLNSSEMNVHFPPQFEVIYSKDSGSSVTNKLMYDSVRNMSAETVVDGRAHLLNESLPGEAYLVVHDFPRGMRFVFSPSPSCSVEAFHGSNDTSSNEFLRPIDLFIPQLSTLNFTLHSNVSGLLEYRSSWGDKVIEARVQNTTLSTVAIYSKGTLESIIELTIKEVKPHFEDSVGLASLLRECFNRFSDNLVSFELIGVSSEMMSKRREDAVWDKMATTLASIPNASINPYRLSFFSVGDGEAETKNTRVVMRVADGKDSTAKEMTSSQFLILLNSTLPGGISINVSDTEIWKTGDLLVPYPPLPPVVPPAFSGYTGGSMLVLGLFMVMLGAVVGAGGVYLAFRRQRISTLAYQVFE